MPGQATLGVGEALPQSCTPSRHHIIPSSLVLGLDAEPPLCRAPAGFSALLLLTRWTEPQGLSRSQAVRSTEAGEGQAAPTSLPPPAQAAGVMLAVRWARAVNRERAPVAAAPTRMAPPAASGYPIPIGWGAAACGR